jgi:hypothetical protein
MQFSVLSWRGLWLELTPLWVHNTLRLYMVLLTPRGGYTKNKKFFLMQKVDDN